MPFNAPLPAMPSASASLYANALNIPNQPGGQLMFNWQASKATVKERLATLYNREVLADVHFLVGKGSQHMNIPAHKFVLSMGSAVFDAMFNGAMATQSD